MSFPDDTPKLRLAAPASAEPTERRFVREQPC